ncbi:unnamed protein product [Prorocentrum cordatum]|uniref:Uncharacterized protein n=1 Tax=Prorocentrum cordatum TaxID=2364126 RepID=A0ABN9Y967_9DINO|nr:unnamed protein product [Polarella glacialis]
MSCEVCGASCEPLPQSGHCAGTRRTFLNRVARLRLPSEERTAAPCETTPKDAAASEAVGDLLHPDSDSDSDSAPRAWRLEGAAEGGAEAPAWKKLTNKRVHVKIRHGKRQEEEEEEGGGGGGGGGGGEEGTGGNITSPHWPPPTQDRPPPTSDRPLRPRSSLPNPGRLHLQIHRFLPLLRHGHQVKGGERCDAQDCRGHRERGRDAEVHQERQQDENVQRQPVDVVDC